MKIEKLNEVLKNFQENSDRTILIDGPWGCGKTHCILDFLKEEKKNKKSKNKSSITYLSLFGKTSVDEIHLELYRNFHKAKHFSKKIINVLPKISGLFGEAGKAIENLEYTLKTDRNSKINDGKKRRIIILDDFERLDFNKIPFREILGYINSLIMQQLKVIIICNGDEIVKNDYEKDFLAFKEKVFDREYKISATNKEVISRYFSKYDNALNDIVIDEFKSNLRIANRVRNFFDEIVESVYSINTKYQQQTSNSTLLLYCTFVVISTNTRCYEGIEENDKEKDSDYMLMHIEDFKIDDYIKNTMISIYRYNRIKKYESYLDINLLLAIFKVFFYNDKDDLIEIFREKDLKRKEDCFAISPFYLSDEDKKSLFKFQLERFFETKDLKDVVLRNTFLEMYRYDTFSEVKKYEDKIIEHIVSQKHLIENEIYQIIDYVSFDKEPSDFKIFSNKLESKYHEALLNERLNILENLWQQKEYSKLKSELYDFTSKSYCHEKGKYDTLSPKITDMFRKNEYFLSGLLENIDVAQWELAHRICDYALKYNFKEEVIDFINSIDFKSSESARERYGFLLQKLGS